MTVGIHICFNDEILVTSMSIGREVNNELCFFATCSIVPVMSKFNDTQKQLSLQGKKAMFSLKSKTNEMYLNTETMLSLFDTYVRSVLNYGCVIWGFHNGKDVEKVQLQYLKTLLGVKKTTRSAVFLL